LNYYPLIRGVTFAIPNGGSRHLLEAVNLKRCGATKGVPDTFMCISNKTACGLFIEFKAGNNKASKEQMSMMEKLRDNGYECHIVYSLNEAREVVSKYLTTSKYGSIFNVQFSNENIKTSKLSKVSVHTT
jgi:hypothetical protein